VPGGAATTHDANTRAVNQIEEFVAIVADLKSKNSQDLILFRGQRDSGKPLVPKIGRPEANLKGKNQFDLGNIEQRIFEAFQRLSLPSLHMRPETILEWLAVPQQHGLATCLLDWTTNAMAALRFPV